MNPVELKDLCGEHVLTGVDRTSQIFKSYGGDEDSQVINFTLDGKTYTAAEDPSDGYRSSMRYCAVSDEPTKNTFAPVRVVGRLKEIEPGDDDAPNVLQLFDVVTGKLVLEVGTENADSYYPYWVACFSPENMAINQEGKI